MRQAIHPYVARFCSEPVGKQINYKLAMKNIISYLLSFRYRCLILLNHKLKSFDNFQL